MKKFFKILGIVLLILAIGVVAFWFFYLKPPPPPISMGDRTRLQLMPLPSELKFGDDFLVITSDFGVSLETKTSGRLQKAIDRFYDELGTITGLSFKTRNGNQLSLEYTIHENTYPQLGDDESYELNINDAKITLKATSETGILYGLTSLLQLVEQRDGQWVFPELQMFDHPRYPWRGLMIDVSRHWIPKEVVLRNLDAMAKLKMNVFHWHLSDYQGFRVESKQFPKLHEQGSEGNFYTQEEVKEVVLYAADRGIRVIPEFDVPGHATSWLVGYPELGSAPGPYVLDSVTLGVFRPVMDPTNEDVYVFLDAFIGEMITLFPDDYFHIGGDEVLATDWEENQHIQEYMKVHSIDDPHELQAHFNLRLQKIVAKHHKIMLGWDEILHPDLPVDGIAVQAWRNHKSLWDAARKGNQAILSNGYYLDHKKSAADYYAVDPEVIKGAVAIEIDSLNWTSWKTQIHFGESAFEGSIYTFGEGDDIDIIMDFMDNAIGISEVQKNIDHIEFTNEIDIGEMKVVLDIQGDSLIGTAAIGFFDLDLEGVQSGGSEMIDGLPLPKFDKIEPLTDLESKNILGGEACMWTEMVDSITLESRIWPKAAAIAEKLWSPQVLSNDTDDMYRRLILMDAELEKLGVHHKKQQQIILSNMVADQDVAALNFLVDFLHEGAFVNRLSLYQPTLYTTTPLDNVVDAASAESYPAYVFNKKVTEYIDTGDEQLKNEIQILLQKWVDNHDKLAHLFDTNEKVQMIQDHSKNLSQLSAMALKITEGKELSDNETSSLEELLQSAKQEYGGTVLAVVPGLEMLIIDSNGIRKHQI